MLDLTPDFLRFYDERRPRPLPKKVPEMGATSTVRRKTVMSYISSQEKSSLEMKKREQKESYVMPTSDGIAQLAMIGGNAREKRTKDEYRAELSRVRKELAREKERLKEMKGKEKEEVEAVRRVMEEEGKERVREMKVRLGKEEVAGAWMGREKGMEGNGRGWKKVERKRMEGN